MQQYITSLRRLLSRSFGVVFPEQSELQAPHCASAVRHTLKFLVAIAGFSFIFSSCSNKRSEKPTVLVFSKTEGYTHASIPDGIAAIEKLGKENGFDVHSTQDAAAFTEENLKQYSAVIFLSTTGDVLNKYQEADFERYIQSGGGFVGIHAASDTEYHWGWYGRMVGGYFKDHPGINDPHPNVQLGTLIVEDSTHASTEFLPKKWKRTDEWYSFKNFNEEVNVLLSIDENSYKGGADMGFHPMAWYHNYDGGRIFYTALGHTKESYSEELFLNHILGGINYAIGDNPKPDYDQVTTHRVPEANRFSKVALVRGTFLEPIAMTVLPNRDVLIVQRRGEVLLYKHEDSTLTEAGKLDVYWKASNPDVNAEEGVVGIKADPNFENNNHVFIYYSPADTTVNRLSRFTFVDDKLQMDSEEIILELYSQRNICCHTGGSMAFDSQGLLYLSTGDNTTPFDQKQSKHVLNGYAPLDEREGFRPYNALRSSGNANDLRGKILRIKVNEDGSYDIPEGNLYAEGREGTRPEIYVQGNRNPYTISIDKKTGYLYWGEIGPDANTDSMQTKGPRGYDEINQAREAGFFGWPMFIGPNYAYRRFDYATGKPGKAFDPENPVNDSRYNTGIKNLPKPKPAFIWYPYARSDKFPETGTGGRNSMAGPVYHTENYPKDSRLPEYFDGKLFIYDWVRNWIKVVTMWPDGDFSKMEPFMKETDFNAVIDMEVGPEGRIYLLEYGSGWFTQNEDASLSFIKYVRGNRKPVIHELAVNKTSGVLPLTIKATADATDPENDRMTYVWDMGDGTTRQTSLPSVEHTYNEIGEYNITVQVKDEHGLTRTSNPVSVYAGNEAPTVRIKLKGNNSFYFPGTPVKYEVEVVDGDNPDAPFDPSSLVVSADYVKSTDMAEASQGHQIMTETMRGRNLIQTLDCQSCHKIDAKSVAPSYMAIAERYADSSNAASHLTNVIINGGSGRWGETPMPAHLSMSEEDARSIVTFIQSLVEPNNQNGSLPRNGTINPTLGKQASIDGVLILSASYTDTGGPDAKPLTGSTVQYLRNSNINLINAKNLDNYTRFSFRGNNLLSVPEESGSFSLNQIDLTNIGSVMLITASREPTSASYRLEIRLDQPDGKIIGEATLDSSPRSDEPPFIRNLNIDLEPVTDGKLHDLYFVSHSETEDSPDIFLSNLTFMPAR